MEFRVIIPVRYDSTRLPGKALAEVGGKPIVQYVYESAIKSGAIDVIIATDDERIAKAAEKFGAQVCMTSTDHQSGTERLAEAVVALGLEDDDIIVALQGDEPLIPPDAIRKVAEDLGGHDNVKVASVCTPITSYEELCEPNITKVVLNHRHYALYFSHAPIPWEPDRSGKDGNIELNGEHYRHIGIYAYRVGFLQEYMEWEDSPYEKMEALEQLRILWHGCRIHMVICNEEFPPGIDTKKDLERVKALIE